MGGSTGGEIPLFIHRVVQNVLSLCGVTTSRGAEVAFSVARNISNKIYQFWCADLAQVVDQILLPYLGIALPCTYSKCPHAVISWMVISTVECSFRACQFMPWCYEKKTFNHEEKDQKNEYKYSTGKEHRTLSVKLRSGTYATMLKHTTWVCNISCNYTNIPSYNWIGQCSSNHI